MTEPVESAPTRDRRLMVSAPAERTVIAADRTADPGAPPEAANVRRSEGEGLRRSTIAAETTDGLQDVAEPVRVLGEKGGGSADRLLLKDDLQGRRSRPTTGMAP